MLLNRRIGAVMGANIDGRHVRPYIFELKALVFAPIVELLYGTAVGLPGIVVGDLRNEELHELPLGLFAGVHDHGRQLQTALGELTTSIRIVRRDFSAHRFGSVRRS